MTIQPIGNLNNSARNENIVGHGKHALVGGIGAVLVTAVAIQKSGLFGLLSDHDGPMFLAYEGLLFGFVADVFIPGVIIIRNKKLRDHAKEELKRMAQIA